MGQCDLGCSQQELEGRGLAWVQADDDMGSRALSDVHPDVVAARGLKGQTPVSLCITPDEDQLAAGACPRRKPPRCRPSCPTSRGRQHPLELAEAGFIGVRDLVERLAQSRGRPSDLVQALENSVRSSLEAPCALVQAAHDCAWAESGIESNRVGQGGILQVLDGRRSRPAM
jgi:hypothetical protein